jgi:hypothetical protein
MRFTPKINQFIREAPTLELCPACSGVAVSGEVCMTCFGAGMVTVEVGDRWRVAHGVKPKRGPLPPAQPPSK